MNETTILVIEDDKSIQNFMKISLKTRGWLITDCPAYPSFTRIIRT
jgi:DNA-binding response OmpR family regulator